MFFCGAHRTAVRLPKNGRKALKIRNDNFRGYLRGYIAISCNVMLWNIEALCVAVKRPRLHQ